MDRSLGMANWSYKEADGSIVSAGIAIDPTPLGGPESIYGIIAHELLHTLGRFHPVDLYRDDTVMGYNFDDLPYITYQLDRDALLAVYGWMDIGTTKHEIYEELGGWNSYETNVGRIITFPGYNSFAGIEADGVMFGVRSSNGLAQPWVMGKEPLTWIWDNPELIGSASWSGRLAGITPNDEVVWGVADMKLTLSTLDGNLDFTEMERWAPRQMPDEPGGGRMWGDGDLHYSVQVAEWNGDAFGNYEPKVGDDYGIVDGGFFGVAHEGMGGTLERDDLTAAFGGKR